MRSLIQIGLAKRQMGKIIIKYSKQKISNLKIYDLEVKGNSNIEDMGNIKEKKILKCAQFCLKL